MRGSGLQLAEIARSLRGRSVPDRTACRARPPSTVRRSRGSSVPQARQSSTPAPTSAQPSSSSLVPAGAMSLTWAETRRSLVAPQPRLRLGAAAHQPGDIGLPGQRTAFRLGEDQFERGRRAVLRLAVPSYGCGSRSRMPSPAKRVAKRAEFASERAPAGRVHVALFRRHGGHEELVEAEQPAGRGDLVRALPQRGQADMRRRTVRPRASSFAFTFAASSRCEPMPSTLR